MTATDTPCAGCPSPILAGAPRLSELVRVLDSTGVTVGLIEYHPGCWAAEQRRSEGAA